jgi:hypothetical protein
MKRQDDMVKYQPENEVLWKAIAVNERTTKLQILSSGNILQISTFLSSLNDTFHQN